jgi:rhodanese-related sulfurtransferase
LVYFNLKMEKVDCRTFYNLIVPCEYLLLDLRSVQNFEKNHIDTSVNVLKNFKSIPNDSERKNKILIYKNEETEQELFEKVLNYFKGTKIQQLHIETLSDPFQEFNSLYPFLCSKSGVSDNIFPAHIIDNIFLSSYFVAQNKSVLKSMNVKFILNVSNDCKNDFEKDSELKIKYHRCLISDSSEMNPRDFFDECHQFFKNSEGNILVHCYQGISRSSTMIISVINEYLIQVSNETIWNDFK